MDIYLGGGATEQDLTLILTVIVTSSALPVTSTTITTLGNTFNGIWIGMDAPPLMSYINDGAQDINTPD